MPNPHLRLHSRTFLTTATVFEVGLVILAYLIGGWVDCDPLAHWHWRGEAVFWGLLGTGPLCLLFWGAYRLPLRGLAAIRRLLIDRLGAVLNACHWREWLYLALLAGITEEILFRGLLQPWAESRWGWLAGLAGSNLLFALAHAITPLYALLAGLIGVYLGLSLDFGSERNLLTPMAIHALYDFVAFVAVVRTYQTEQGINMPPLIARNAAHRPDRPMSPLP